MLLISTKCNVLVHVKNICSRIIVIELVLKAQEHLTAPHFDQLFYKKEIIEDSTIRMFVPSQMTLRLYVSCSYMPGLLYHPSCLAVVQINYLLKKGKLDSQMAVPLILPPNIKRHFLQFFLFFWI